MAENSTFDKDKNCKKGKKWETELKTERIKRKQI